MYRLRQGSLLPARAVPVSCASLAPRCRSGADLGVGVERTVLLNSLALCLVVDGAWKQADVGIRPYKGDGDAAIGRTHKSTPHTVL